MRGNRTVLVAAGLALLLAPAAALAQEQGREQVAHQRGHTKEWDQAAATEFASQFSTEITAARAAYRKVPPPNVGSMQARSHFVLTDLLRVLEREARRLHTALGEGKGHDELQPAYARMWVTIRDAQEEARRLMVPQQVEQHFAAASAALVELDAYFD